MTDTEQGLPDPSPDTLQMLEDFLRLQVAERADASPATDTATLVRYIAGALSEKEIYLIERALTRDRALRPRVRQVRAALETLRTADWETVRARAEQQGEHQEIAAAWVALAEEQGRLVPHARAAWLTASLEQVRSGAREGLVGAIATWMAFIAFGQTLKAALRAPQPALARDSERMEVLASGAPAGVRCFADAMIDRGGALQVQLELVDVTDGPVGTLDDTPVTLLLRAEGDLWPVATDVLQDGRAAFAVPGLAEALELRVTGLPPGSLAVSIGEEPLAASASFGLIASVVDTEGMVSGPGLVLPIEGAPGWQDGQLNLSILVPAVLRRAYGDRVLCLEAALISDLPQRLGAWPIAEWGDTPRRLTMAFPGGQTAVADGVSFLRATLRPISS